MLDFQASVTPDVLSFTSNSVKVQVGNSAVQRGQEESGTSLSSFTWRIYPDYSGPAQQGQRARGFFPLKLVETVLQRSSVWAAVIPYSRIFRPCQLCSKIKYLQRGLRIHHLHHTEPCVQASTHSPNTPSTHLRTREPRSESLRGIRKHWKEFRRLNTPMHTQTCPIVLCGYREHTPNVLHYSSCTVNRGSIFKKKVNSRGPSYG